MMYVGICTEATTNLLNTGASSQCLEAITQKLVVAKSAFRFNTLADFQDKANWDAAIQSKDIVPLYEVYEVVDNNTEATFYETGNFKRQTSKEVKKMTCEAYLSICSHRALKSFEGSDYTQVFEITENGEVIAVYDDDGQKVKGQDITDFDVSIRSRPTADKPANTVINVTYRDFNEVEEKGIIDKFAWDVLAINGIFSLTLMLVGNPSDTQVQFKALMSCGVNTYSGLVSADMVFPKDSDDSAQALTLSAPDTSGVYTATGVGLESGKLSTNGVRDKSTQFVESDVLSVTI